MLRDEEVLNLKAEVEHWKREAENGYAEVERHLVTIAANIRLQRRLDDFKRVGSGYRCCCRHYEATIDELHRQLALALQNVKET